MHAVQGFDQGPVLIVRVPKSSIGLHMVTYQGAQYFWGRSSAGKHRLDVVEIRDAFLSANELPKRLAQFRRERVARVLAGEAPAALRSRGIAVLHIVPLAALGNGVVDVRRLHEHSSKLAPMGTRNWEQRYNSDGLLTYGAHVDGPRSTYVQAFRTGAVEAAYQGLVGESEGRAVIFSEAYEKDLIQMVARALSAFKEVDVSPPVFIGTTLIGVKGTFMGVGRRLARDPEEELSIDTDVLFLPDIELDSLALEAKAVARACRPMFDVAWQAAGWDGSQNYDDAGEWVRQPRR
jgi:hypothetical protein